MSREYITPEERASLGKIRQYRNPSKRRETSKQRKEREELEECTFQPRINTGYRSPNKNRDLNSRRVEKLIEWGEAKNSNIIKKRLNR